MQKAAPWLIQYTTHPADKSNVLANPFLDQHTCLFNIKPRMCQAHIAPNATELSLNTKQLPFDKHH